MMRTRQPTPPSRRSRPRTTDHALGPTAGLLLGITLSFSCSAHRPLAADACDAPAPGGLPPKIPAVAAAAPDPQACPDGQARRASGGDPLPLPEARAVPAAPVGEDCLPEGCWYHAGRSDWVVADGAGAWIDVERPRAPPGAHSLAELALRGPRSPKDSIEIGWRVSPTLHGDAEPHLFVHRWIHGEPCSGDCGWRQRGARWAPGMPLTPQLGHPLSVGWYFHQGRWWAWVQDEWIGYFEDVEWADSFRRARLVQWFGEVFAAGEPPGVSMGNGRFAEDPAAARFGRLCVVSSGRCRPFSPAWAEITRAALYSVAQDPEGFRYGGPGTTANLTPRPPPSSASGETPLPTGTSAPSLRR